MCIIPKLENLEHLFERARALDPRARAGLWNRLYDIQMLRRRSLWESASRTNVLMGCFLQIGGSNKALNYIHPSPVMRLGKAIHGVIIRAIRE
jgi:hypothetical protein